MPTPGVTPTPPATVSPTPVTVAYYLCVDLATARAQIEGAGLKVGTLVYQGGGSGDDSWIVHDQFPAPGTRVPPGSEVSLILDAPDAPCP